jgi:hypothetical protein
MVYAATEAQLRTRLVTNSYHFKILILINKIISYILKFFSDKLNYNKNILFFKILNKTNGQM